MRKVAKLKDSHRGESAEQRFRRTGIGSVFFAGTMDPANGGARVDQTKIETRADFFRRMLNELNRPRRAWKTPRLQSVIEADLDTNEVKAVVQKINKLSKGFQDYLRERVDLWIGTGQDPKTGADRPSSRVPNKMIQDIVERIFATHRAIPIPLRDGYTVSPLPQGTLRTDGDNGLEAAELMFVEMLLSPWRLRIAKCKECDKYFKLKQWERTYCAGTFCGPCVPRRKDQRSKEYKEILRKDAAEGLYEKAAQRFWRQILDRPMWNIDVAFKTKIAEYLSQQIKGSPELLKCYRNGAVTIKWLSRRNNRNGIENKVEEIGRGYRVTL